MERERSGNRGTRKTSTTRARGGVCGRRVLGAVALALALPWAAGTLGCRPQARGGRAENVVRALFTQDPLSLTFIGKGDRESEIVGRLLSDPLVQYDASLTLRPRVAESWEVSPDGREVTFRLRRDVRWHDGQPVTARDVVFTVETIRDPASESRTFVSAFDGLDSVEAIDDHTVRAVYAEPSPDFLEGWYAPLVPQHLAGRDDDFLTGEFSRRPVGCGPFRFVEHVPGQRVVLEANPDYWDGPPRLDRLVLRVFPDERTAYQALLTGELDLMPATPDIYREAQESERAGHLEGFVYERMTVWYVAWNQDGSNPFFTDPRVRRAMVLALDREGLARQVFHDLAVPGLTTYLRGSRWADPDLEPWPYDPRAARALLSEAGWRDVDGDGLRERDGREFSFTLLYGTSSQEAVERMAAWIQQSLAEIGVRAELEKLEKQAFAERRRAHRFEAAMSGLSLTPIPDQFELYHSTARERGFNYAGLADGEVDALLEAGRTTFDDEARIEVYRKLQRRLHELEPLTPLFRFLSPHLRDARLQGVETAALDIWRIVPGPRAWYWGEGD